jgi:hypothetical protein
VTEQEKLRNYIEATTKQDYPDFVGEVAPETEEIEEKLEEEIAGLRLAHVSIVECHWCSWRERRW